jgi:hypothetical protein
MAAHTCAAAAWPAVGYSDEDRRARTRPSRIPFTSASSDKALPDCEPLWLEEGIQMMLELPLRSYDDEFDSAVTTSSSQCVYGFIVTTDWEELLSNIHLLLLLLLLPLNPSLPSSFMLRQ